METFSGSMFKWCKMQKQTDEAMFCFTVKHEELSYHCGPFSEEIGGNVVAVGCFLLVEDDHLWQSRDRYTVIGSSDCGMIKRVSL